MKQYLKNLRTTLLFCIIVILVTACIKENTEKSADLKPHQENVRYIFPVNLNKYNLLPYTKSGDIYPSFSFSYSMLDSSKVYQEEVKPGRIFTQTPLKGVLYCSFGELGDKAVVQAGIFHIKYENCYNGVEREYIVTMIPASGQLERNPDFSFLNMPDFSGVIIFSGLSGEFKKVWELDNGLISFSSLERKDSLVKSGTITFYSPSAIPGGSIVKSANDPEDETVVDGGKLNECVVIGIYRRSINNGFWEVINYVENTRPLEQEDPDIPIGGGSPSEEEKEVFYTLTIISQFCDNRSFSLSAHYPKRGEALLSAGSLSNDSCIFHCWLNGNSVVSTAKTFTITMTKDYTFKAKYQHISNEECYKLAKFSSDSLLRSKIDSLRRGYSSVEKGIARREDGSYYKMTGGTSTSIPMPDEDNIKYSMIYHTHPSGYCCLSPGDLIGLYLMFLKKRYTSPSGFHFGVVTDNGVISLNITDIEKFNRYFEKLRSKSRDEAKKIIKRDIDDFVKNMSYSNDYNSYLRKAVPFFADSIGLSTLYTKRGDNKNEIWSSLRYSATENNLIWKDCIKN